MQLFGTALAATAILGASALLDHPEAAAPDAVEVVFTSPGVGFACDGCKATFTDTMAGGGAFTCPNGDRWSFTVSTPVVSDGKCVNLNYACLRSGACTFERTGTLTRTDPGPGRCPLWFVLGDVVPDAGREPAAPGQQWVFESVVECRTGSTLTQDCVPNTLRLHGGVLDDTPVLSWVVTFCCNRCPL